MAKFKIINFINLIFLILSLLSFINLSFSYNVINLEDFKILNPDDNLNNIFPKPKFMTFQALKGDPKNINEFDSKRPFIELTNQTIIKFQDDEQQSHQQHKQRYWTENDMNHIRQYYHYLFKVYPTREQSYSFKEIIFNNRNNYENTTGTSYIIEIIKIPTLSEKEYKSTHRNTIPFGSNENYEIISSQNGIRIYVNSKFGVLHAFKSLFQSGDFVLANSPKIKKYNKNKNKEKEKEKEKENDDTQQNERIKKLYFYNYPFSIVDKPRLNYRGLLIDTGRHFLSVEYIKQIITSMSLLKMNALHWHITDDQSFPLEVPEYPLLYRKGSNHLGYIHNFISTTNNKTENEEIDNNNIYHQQKDHLNYYKLRDIKEIIKHAEFMGVRVIPEVDIPGHSLSWGKSYSDLVCSCPKYLEKRRNHINGEYTFSAPLDPSNNFAYLVIESILKTVKSVFTDPYLHLGFDEIPFDCWLENSNLVSDMFKNHNLSSPSKYLSFFLKKVNQILLNLKNHNNGDNDNSILMWEDIIPMLDSIDQEELLLNNNNNNNYDIIFQLWKGRDEYDRFLLKNKRPFIYSFGNYLDPSYQSCNTFSECLLKQQELIEEFEKSKLMIGMEACAWEMIPYGDIMSTEKDGISKHDRGFPDRVWTRLFGIAEKMWYKPMFSFNESQNHYLNQSIIDQIKENSITRAKFYIKILDLIIQNQNLVDSSKLDKIL
ncbi:hypothetical protein RB653_000613 [Dictyostelium firmibasis]|uniref:beta-N-acetylhexosaminidase n=1 Tax=Dictyostelium firmibasis TaxID=79012 RepID=A0AAN7TWZ8_9MYCE